MTTVIHKEPEFIAVSLCTLENGNCFRIQDKDNDNLYMKIETPGSLLRWLEDYADEDNMQCAIDLDNPNKTLWWFKPWRMVKPIDVEIKEL